MLEIPNNLIPKLEQFQNEYPEIVYVALYFLPIVRDMVWYIA